VHTGSAIVTFQPSGAIEVRAEPADRYQLEVRGDQGLTRTTVYAWEVGDRATAVQMIRYHRGEAVEERRVSKGGSAHVDVSDLADTLRLRAASLGGPPVMLELRLVEAVAAKPGPPSPPGLPPLPGDAVAALRTKPRTMPPAMPRATPAPAPAAKSKGTINDLIGAVDRRIAQRIQPLLDKLCEIELSLEAAQGATDALIGESHHDHRDPVAEAFGQVREAVSDLHARLIDGLDPEGTKARLEALASGIDQLRRSTEAASDAEVVARLDAMTFEFGAKLDAHPDGSEALTRIEHALSKNQGVLTAGFEAAFEALANRMPAAASFTELSDGMETLLELMPPATDLAPLEARLEALAERMPGTPDLGPITQRLAALAERMPGTPDLGPITQRLAALADRMPAPTNLAPVEAKLTALAAAMPAATDLGPVQSNLGEVRLLLDELTEAQIDPLALVTQLGEVVKNTQDAGFEPLYAGLDRAEQDRASLGERVGVLTDRFITIEDGLGTQMGEQLAQSHALLERVHGVVSAPSAEANRLGELAEQLKRLERALLAAPSMDGKLTALGIQLRRIEETAGAITPEVFEIIAARLEAVDPRPSFSATAERVETATAAVQAALEARIGIVTDAVEAKLEARLGEATPLAGRLARLEQAVNARPDTGWLRGRLVALREGLDDVERIAGASLEQQPALIDRLDGLGETLAEVHARPAFPADLQTRLAAVEAQLGVVAQSEAMQARFGAVDERLTHIAALTERPAMDYTATFETFEDTLGRLERRLRNDGNQADRAMAAAVAAMGTLGHDDQFEAIEERLVRMERAIGGAGGKLDPALVARFEAAANKAADAPEVDQKLEIITGHLRTLTTRPMAIPAPDTDVADRLEALAAQVAALATVPSSVAMPADLAQHLAGLNARLDAEADARTEGAIAARLDALATTVEALAQRPAAEPSGLEAALEALNVKVDALANRAMPEAAGAPADRSSLAGTLEALDAKVHALANRATPEAAGAPADLSGLAGALEALNAKVDALGEAPSSLTTPASAQAAPTADGLLLEQFAGLADRLELISKTQVKMSRRMEAVAESVEALELSHPMPPTPIPPPMPAEGLDDDDVVELDLDDDDFEIEIDAPEPRRPEVERRSPDGAMLDQIELLIDVVHSQHVDQQSVRGLLSGERLDTLLSKTQALQTALEGIETGSTGRLVAELVGRIEDARIDRLRTAQTALIEGDFATAIESVSKVLAADDRAPLTADNLERTLVGIGSALWAAQPQGFGSDGARDALQGLLGELQIGLIVPETNTTWQPTDQRVQARRPGQPGQPLNRILEINAPGFSRNDEIIEKAAVTISD
jgi:hypothetical protein